MIDGNSQRSFNREDIDLAGWAVDDETEEEEEDEEEEEEEEEEEGRNCTVADG